MCFFEVHAAEPLNKPDFQDSLQAFFFKTNHAEQSIKPSFIEFLRASATSRQVIDRFLAQPVWTQYDPELGYIQNNYTGRSPVAAGIDNSATISTLQKNGARTAFMYAGVSARINTYGDSITQCNQVNDGETWQEYLAGHLGEPVRNFGVGGYGVYQAYRRMLREEASDHGAEYLILTICCDDATRSLFRDRYPLTRTWGDAELRDRELFGVGVPWPNIEMDLRSGQFVERNSLLPTPESLYELTKPAWFVEHLKDDLALQLALYKAGAIKDLNRKAIDKLAAWLDFKFNWESKDTLRNQAGTLLDRYGQFATVAILSKARDFSASHGKKLLVVLNLTTDWTRLKTEGMRDDQVVVDYLKKENFRYLDMNEVHLKDFLKYDLSWADYVLMKRYAVNDPTGPGHYSPLGNSFIAYSLKDKVVEMLDPKPIPYRK